MNTSSEINQGEIQINLHKDASGKKSLKDLGLTETLLLLEGGFLRIQIRLDGVGMNDYFHTPTIQIAYKENTGETHWQCEFNGETILDRMDHHGNSTVLLLNRGTLEKLEHHHENTLIVHGEFPEKIHIDTEASFMHLLK
ncbi:MAG: hypothetical protein KDD36_10195 [Flavobacteriales bacterium]|nr:hypothetical protein [Flavobacteriales bacterium]